LREGEADVKRQEAQFARAMPKVRFEVPGTGIRFERTLVGGERAEHGRAGNGPPVLFLHGWGLGPRSYSASLSALVDIGCSVFAPAQPGFGGTPGLEGDDCTFCGYAKWLSSYLDALGVAEPVVVVGHSFGGGVAIQFAHDHPERVRGLVSCNGVGGLASSGPADRPWWDWGRHLGSDLLALESVARVLPALLSQALPNIVLNPLAMWRVSEFVRRADLRREARALSQRNMPMMMVWSDRDRIVSHGSFSALCKAACVEGVVVPGHHSWLIADPRRFSDVMLRALVEAGVVEETLSRLTA
jgi:pimeloyl-ACP methyl ester carboxylesterase